MPIPEDGTSSLEREARAPAAPSSDPTKVLLKSVVDMIVPIWKAQQRLLPEVEDNRAARIAVRHLEEAQSAIGEFGFEVRDYAGQSYDAGLRPITPIFEERDECKVETVVKTLTPAVFLQGKILLKSRAIVGVPAVEQELPRAPANPKAEPDRLVEAAPVAPDEAVGSGTEGGEIKAGAEALPEESAPETQAPTQAEQEAAKPEVLDSPKPKARKPRTTKAKAPRKKTAAKTSGAATKKAKSPAAPRQRKKAVTKPATE